MSQESESQDSGPFVTAFARGLSVIRSFRGEDSFELTLSEVAERTGLTRATARRFLLTLVELGYAQVERKRFRLTAKVLDLSYGYMSWSIWDIAYPHMERLANELNESCSAGVLDGGDLIYAARAPAKRFVPLPVRLGTRIPAHGTSMGLILMAYLTPDKLSEILDSRPLQVCTQYTITDPAILREEIAKARAQGYALTSQSIELGWHSVSVPIFNRSFNALAALSIAAHMDRVPEQQMIDEIVPLLQSASKHITTTLGA